MGELLNFPAHRMAQTARPISKARLCERLGVSPRWVEYRMREGMPFRKDAHSRVVRFDVAAVEAWLSERRTG